MPHEFEAQDGDVRSTAFPQLVRANGSAHPVSGYAFDAATIEAIYFAFLASDYISGDVIITLEWYAATATSGNCMWGAQLAAVTPNVDTQDAETDALQTLATVTSAAGASSHRRMRSVITLTGGALDSLATNDVVTIAVSRQASNAADTMTGDAVLTYVSVNA